MSAETRTTSSTGGQKGVKLERFDLIPVGPLTALAVHFGRGALKYDDDQWRKGYEWSKSYAAKQRHDNLFWAGFDYDVCENDPEGCAHVDQHGEPFEGSETENGSTCYNHTGSHHLDASNWHGFVLREFTVTHPEHDDRYTTKQARAAEEAEEAEEDPYAIRFSIPTPFLDLSFPLTEVNQAAVRLAMGLPEDDDLSWERPSTEVLKATNDALNRRD